MNRQPIGFIDSGVGGLSVIKQVMKELPKEDIIFIGDSARNPYGPRSQKEVLKFTIELANFLLEKKIKILVLACNTATVSALDYLKKNLDIPVIGVIEPGGYAAANTTKNKNIGLIGTNVTVNSNAYDQIIKEIDNEIEIYKKASPKLVDVVENNEFTSSQTAEIIQEELSELKNTSIDTLILGCTHYPLIEKQLENELGNEITLVDPAVETVKKLKNILLENNLQNMQDQSEKKSIFFTTDNTDSFSDTANNWLSDYSFDVKYVSLKEIEKNE